MQYTSHSVYCKIGGYMSNVTYFASLARITAQFSPAMSLIINQPRYVLHLQRGYSFSFKNFITPNNSPLYNSILSPISLSNLSCHRRKYLMNCKVHSMHTPSSETDPDQTTSLELKFSISDNQDSIRLDTGETVRFSLVEGSNILTITCKSPETLNNIVLLDFAKDCISFLRKNSFMQESPEQGETLAKEGAENLSFSIDEQLTLCFETTLLANTAQHTLS